MKRTLLLGVLLSCMSFAFGQTTYYWVGGANPTTITTGSNWNTSLDGSGTSRPSATGATDILVFNGLNIGGATPATGLVTVPVNGGVTAGQLKFINNANVSFIRTTTGTGTINLSGGAGDDFVIEAGSNLSFLSTTGSVVIAMVAANTGVVSGNFSMITTLQARIANTTAGSPGSLRFTSGAIFRTNITSASSAYAFGNNTQSSEKWVVFESGSHLYYEGGFSPMGNNSAFSAIDFKPGSTWHHKANNPATGFGSFFNRKSFANIVVENNSTLLADGPVYRIDSLTVMSGSTLTTHTSGQTVVLDDLTVHGNLNSPAGSTNEIVMGGNTIQSISGSGIISVAGLVVNSGSGVELNTPVILSNSGEVLGYLDFNTNTLTGAGSFKAVGKTAAIASTANTTNGSYQITGNTVLNNTHRGYGIAGANLSPNTSIVSFSQTFDTVYLSRPAIATGTGVALSSGTTGAFLETSNANGFNPATGSVQLTGNQNFGPGISYIHNVANATPFGITTGSTASFVELGSLVLNAAVTTNSSAHIQDSIKLNAGKTSIRAGDTLHLLAGALQLGSFDAFNYFVTETSATGVQGIYRRDAITGANLFPIGTAADYLPATLDPLTSSDFATSVFQGITNEGTPNGTPLAGVQKQTKVDAVWNIERINGSGNATLTLQWAQGLEGSTFTTWPDSDIGIITNLNPGWSLPTAPGNNTTNTASLTVSSFGRFGVGALPPAQPFVFNPIPTKTYGDPDFTAGVISLNTTQPITYTSSNPAVATIVNDMIHIVGIGTTTITASQPSDGFYPAASASQTLTVVKAPLTIKANDITKPEGDPNPPLTVTYTGFVLGQDASVFLTPLVITTTATTSSAPGTYPITVSGATAANYDITFVPGIMTVTARQNQTITFNPFPVKTYGNPDFSIGATSSNPTIPITYTSSNPSVAVIVGNNIHIVGAGTTDIKASQAGNGLFFPAPDVIRTLTVNKANLNVRVRDTSRLVGEPNPPFTITFTGFVLGETTASLTAIPVATTTATPSSAPGDYPITLSGGQSNNYNFIYTNGKLTVLPTTGTTETYVQAFQSGNNTIAVRIYSPAPDLGDVFFYDNGGKLLLKRNVFMAKGFMTFNFNVIGLPSGVYNIVVEGKSALLKTRVILTR